MHVAHKLKVGFFYLSRKSSEMAGDSKGPASVAVVQNSLSTNLTRRERLEEMLAATCTALVIAE